MPTSLLDLLSHQPYQGYAYAYPHKTSYRHFDHPLPLRELWEGEDKSSLFLYLHVPFCEMRCGFCNLFTTTHPENSLVARYLEAMDLQMAAVGEAIGPDARFARGAIGGGTPSFLSISELQQLFQMMQKNLGSFPQGMPLSCELSPATVSPEKLGLLRDNGVTRLSIGIQSFIEEETRAMGRPQNTQRLYQALEEMRQTRVSVMNIDLIYGASHQTISSWLFSLGEALRFHPEEIFLYPLYIRPLTGLARKEGSDPTDQRLELYRAGRDFLRDHGYQQISMRLFRREGTPLEGGTTDGSHYCCQEDGMAGVGAGARSYTQEVHYCTEYAVGRKGIRDIIDEYSRRSFAEHSHAVHGCRLSDQERKRRYLIKSLLRCDGLSLSRYQEIFQSQAIDDFPQLVELIEQHLAQESGDALVLNDRGLERSDTIGPWLFSKETQLKMNDYDYA